MAFSSLITAFILLFLAVELKQITSGVNIVRLPHLFPALFLAGYISTVKVTHKPCYSAQINKLLIGATWEKRNLCSV